MIRSLINTQIPATTMVVLMWEVAMVSVVVQVQATILEIQAMKKITILVLHSLQHQQHRHQHRNRSYLLKEKKSQKFTT